MSAADIIGMRDQMIGRTGLLQELRAAVPALAGRSPAGDSSSPVGGFGDMLAEAVGSVNQVQVKAQAASAAFERGETIDMAQVMLARQEASIAFEATLQVRNHILSAYQDIMRMGV